MEYNQFKDYIILKYNIPPKNKNIKRLYDWVKEKSEEEKKNMLDFLYKFKLVIFSDKGTAKRYIIKEGINPKDYFLFGYVRNRFLVLIKKEQLVEKRKDMENFSFKRLLLNKRDFCEIFRDFIFSIIANKIKRKVIEGSPLDDIELNKMKDYLIRRLGIMLKDGKNIGVKFDSNNEYILKILNECNKVEIVDIREKGGDIWIFFKPKI